MGVYLDLKKSIQRDLVKFSLTNMTDYQSASEFPAGAQLGQTLYRSDLDKLYRWEANVTELGQQWVEVAYDFFFLDFDDHAQIQELPDHHVVGTKSISVSLEEHLPYVSLLIGVSMMNDTNFVQHDRLVDLLFTRYLPTKKIPVYNQSNGSEQGSFICMDGLEVMGIAKADQRPVQFLSLDLATDRTVSLY
jgi:hypothetical protein